MEEPCVARTDSFALRFRIDAFTVFAVPAHGPHGFHAIGRLVPSVLDHYNMFTRHDHCRTIESTLRTMNNLLERLHASFFFYLMVGTATFMKIGSYLPSAVLISTAMLFSGLGEWVKARWVAKEEPEYPSNDKKSEVPHEAAPSIQWASRRRPVLPVLSIIIATHVLGIALFYLRTRTWFISNQDVSS